MFAYLSSYFSSIWNTIFGPLSLLLVSSSQHPKKSGRLLVLGLDNAGKTTLLQAIRRFDPTTTNNSTTTNSTSNNNTNLQQQQQRSYPPTDRPEHIKNIVTIHNQITFHAYDLGGHEAVRHLWSDYYSNDVIDSTNATSLSASSSSVQNNNSNNLAILFCIDIADRQRIEEAAYELDALIHDGLKNSNTNTNDDNHPDTSNISSIINNNKKMGIPIAILLTKCDDMHEMNTTTTTTSMIQKMTLEEVCDYIDYTHLQQYYNGPMHICTISVYNNTGYIEALQWITKTLIQQQQ